MLQIYAWEFVLLFIAVTGVFGALFQIYFPEKQPPDDETGEERAERVLDEFP